MNKPHKKNSKAIKKLEDNAGRGNLFSAFQLYKNYVTGQYVGEPNEEKADHYLAKLSEYLKDTVLKIDSISLREFKRFRHLKVDFHPNLTVIVGDNGAGKTSIVEAVTTCLSYINNNLLRKNVSGKKIKGSAVNKKATDYSELACHFSLNKANHMELALFSPVSGYSGNSTTHIETVKQFGEIHRLLNQADDITIPFLASYPVDRSSAKMPTIALEKGFYRNASSRFNAIKDTLSLGVISEGFVNTFIELTNLAEGEDTQEIRQAKQAIKVLDELIEQRAEQGSEEIRDALLQERDSARQKLTALIPKKSAKYGDLLSDVNAVINTFIPELLSIGVDRSTGSDRLLFKFKNVEVEFNQLSDGQKALISLVGDLTLRLVSLNPHLANPREAQGIVVIDEIDLHLHPKWQQIIPNALSRAFPNLQFILTTHSPQALSTLDNKCIRKIYFDEHGEAKITIPEQQTKGVVSSDILERIMETFSVPPISEARWLSDYWAKIIENTWESNEGKQLFAKIIAHFGDEHPETMKLRSEIRLQQLKNKVHAKKSQAQANKDKG